MLNRSLVLIGSEFNADSFVGTALFSLGFATIHHRLCGRNRYMRQFFAAIKEMDVHPQCSNCINRGK